MVYRVSYLCHVEGHQGYSFHDTLREARKAASDFRKEGSGDRETTVEKHPVPNTKAELLALLQLWGSHADNG